MRGTGVPLRLLKDEPFTRGADVISVVQFSGATVVDGFFRRRAAWPVGLHVGQRPIALSPNPGKGDTFGCSVRGDTRVFSLSGEQEPGSARGRGHSASRHASHISAMTRDSLLRLHVEQSRSVDPSSAWGKGKWTQ